MQNPDNKPQKLEYDQVDQATPVLVNTRGGVKVGIVIPGQKNGGDIYLEPSPVGKDLAQIMRLSEALIPSILGILQLNDLNCVTIDGTNYQVELQRPDFAGSIYVAAIQAMDAILADKGQNNGATQSMQVFSSVDTSDAMHEPHHSKTTDWNKLRQKMQGVGAIGNFETYKGVTESQWRSFKPLLLSHLMGVQPNVQENNIYLQTAFADAVQPRIEATGKGMEKTTSIIAQAMMGGQPLSDTIQQVADRPSRNLIRIK